MSSPRRNELLEAAYEYVLSNGLAGASLRPVADAIGSSTGVLRFLFGSKEGLVTALLARARQDELRMLDGIASGATLAEVGAQTWQWLSDPAHRRLLTLWTECYAASLIDPDGPWAGFARQTVDDWLAVLGRAQSAERRRTADGRAERTAVLAVLRGSMLDLLATTDRVRTTRAITAYLATI
jgi:AcrR family transcriptional regulator